MKRTVPMAVLFLGLLAFLSPRPAATQGSGYADTVTRISLATGWPPLGTASLPFASLEARVWRISALGFHRDSSRTRDPLPLFEGFSIRRDGSSWSGRYIEDGRSSSVRRAVEPRSEWAALWSKLVALGLLTLPDDSGLPNPARVTDGVYYVVELHVDGRYRTYRYSNPEDQTWPEAKQMLQIVATLKDELIPKPWELRWWKF